MAIFTISDLHLSLSCDKPMEIFGSAWNNYIERTKSEWNNCVASDDTVFIGGDVSWAMHLEDCGRDFEFINSLNGSKVISKGNHDYWWESLTKMNKFLEDNGFSTISFMQNNSFLYNDCLICGSRGWILPGDSGFSQNDRKIYERELQRLELSFADGRKKCVRQGIEPVRRICILHYPPFTREHVPDEGFVKMMRKYRVTDCFYGHLHASAAKNAFEGETGGISYKLVSADYLHFKPYMIEQ